MISPYRANGGLLVHLRVLGLHNGVATVDGVPSHFQIGEFLGRLYRLILGLPRVHDHVHIHIGAVLAPVD